MNDPCHVKTIECRSENHVPKVVLGVLHLEGDQKLQWTKNGNNYQCSQLDMKKKKTAQSESELIRVAYVISKVRSGPKIPKTTEHELCSEMVSFVAILEILYFHDAMCFSIIFYGSKSLDHDAKTARMLRTSERRCRCTYTGDNERRT